MKQIAMALVLCVGAWYFFFGGCKLDEAMVRDCDQKEAHAICSRDAERLGGAGAVSQSDFFCK
jgi:hypothetical protein